MAKRKPKTVTEEKKTEPVPPKPAPAEPEAAKTEVIREHGRTTAEAFIQCCHALRVTRTNEVVDILAPIIVRECGISFLPVNNCYARIVLDLKEKNISVWRCTPGSSPTWLMKGVLQEDRKKED